MSRTKSFNKGRYPPKNPDKYNGDVNKIIFRSSWELAFCKFCDKNPNILEWASEEIYIPYRCPLKNSNKRYFPDFWIKYQNKNQEIKQEIIEIKPKSQTSTPKSNTKNPRQRLYEQSTYVVNMAKWQAAERWCNERGIKFRVISEDQLFR